MIHYRRKNSMRSQVPKASLQLLRLLPRQLRWLQASLVLQQQPVQQQRLERRQVLQVLQQEALLVELQVVPEDQPEAHLPQPVQTQLLIAPKEQILRKKIAMMN